MISFMQLVFRDWDEDEVSHTCLGKGEKVVYGNRKSIYISNGKE